MSFILKSYDATLNLADRDNMKLFENGYKGLKSEDTFDGQKGKYSEFAKLIEKYFKDVRVMCAFEIATEWLAIGRTPTQDNMIENFQSCKVQKDLIVSHIDHVWADITFDNLTPEYFEIFDPMPTDTAKLNVLRNLRKLKHVIMGKKIWNSLTSKYKIEILGKRSKFKRGREYDGVILWDFIRRMVNLTTTIGASSYKEEIEKVTLAQFEKQYCQIQHMV